MMRFLSLASPVALIFFLAPYLCAQNTPSPNPPAAQAGNLEQTNAAAAPEDKLQYFSLEHRSADQLDPQDAGLLQKRKRDVLAEAEFYGYDVSAGGWTYEQVVCPLVPDYVMLRYASKDAAGADSLFTVLVPRNGGRIRVVPVLSHGSTRFKPAPSDPRNYQLFSQIVPAEVAKKNSGPDGKWLLLSVCYAEMTGPRLQVPKQPSLDIRMIKAPPPTLRISVGGKEHEVRFVDPISPTDYRLWDITYNQAGRITSVSDDQHGFGEVIVKTIPEPAPKEIPSSRQATPVPQPKPEQPQ